jgi:hypothetical protein
MGLNARRLSAADSCGNAYGGYNGRIVAVSRANATRRSDRSDSRCAYTNGVANACRGAL